MSSSVGPSSFAPGNFQPIFGDSEGFSAGRKAVPVTRSGVAPTRAPREAGGVPEGNPFRYRRWQCMHVDLGEIAD